VVTLGRQHQPQSAMCVTVRGGVGGFARPFYHFIVFERQTKRPPAHRHLTLRRNKQ
jgi:hypothetical protein